jgi:hypothetical protein
MGVTIERKMIDKSSGSKIIIGPFADRAITFYILSAACVVLAPIAMILKYKFAIFPQGFVLFPVSLGIIIIGFMLLTIGVGFGIVGVQKDENYARIVVVGGLVLVLIYIFVALFFLNYLASS